MTDFTITEGFPVLPLESFPIESQIGWKARRLLSTSFNNPPIKIRMTPTMTF
jgi:hypothetical protein